jgi:1-acyl-sn-glycerol-3-phosphate acyltransferase
MTVTYVIISGIAWLINKLVLFIKVENKKNLKFKGKVVLVSNHVSFWDPVFLGGAFKTQLHFMSKAELFKNKIIAWFLNQLGAFPVKRGQGDYAALKRSFEILNEEKCLSIFPEGTRVKNQIGEFQKGAAAIALKMDAPVLPIYIHGDYSLFKRMYLVIGEPINLRDKVTHKGKDANTKGTEVVRQEIIKLKSEFEKNKS